MKKKPGIQKAVNFICQGIEGKRFGEKLPSIKALAKIADVSYVTMWKAIEDLKMQGILASKKGQNIVCDSATSLRGAKRTNARNRTENSDQEIKLFEPPWRKMFSRLKQDILTGRFQPGLPLPSCKELQGIYDVSYPTLKKALSMLESQGIIKGYQRGYIVPAFAKSESASRIVAIGCGWEDGTLWIDHQDKNYFRILESECIQSKISLDIVVYCQQQTSLCFIDTITRKPYPISSDNILGFIVIVANLEIPPYEVLQQLLPHKKPVAVLDVVGGWEASYRTMNNYYCQLFTVTTSMHPPQLVGRYLLNLGHTNIAYISPFHKSLWSQRRFMGIRELFQDAGHASGIHSYVLDDYAFQWDFLQKDIDNAENVKALIAGYNEWQNYADTELFRKFGHFSYNISRYLTEWNCATGEIYHRMCPLFEKTLAVKSITAWVMANDYAATLALDYLKKSKVRVPEDLSVVSFDNTLDAMEYHLSSYDFNLNGIVSMMLRYVLRPSSVSPARGKTVIEAEGAMIERRSTGKNGIEKR